jgi:hypothetical protein
MGLTVERHVVQPRLHPEAALPLPPCLVNGLGNACCESQTSPTDVADLSPEAKRLLGNTFSLEAQWIGSAASSIHSEPTIVETVVKKQSYIP